MQTLFCVNEAQVGSLSCPFSCGPSRALKYGTAAATATRESRLQQRGLPERAIFASRSDTISWPSCQPSSFSGALPRTMAYAMPADAAAPHTPQRAQVAPGTKLERVTISPKSARRSSSRCASTSRASRRQQSDGWGQKPDNGGQPSPAPAAPPAKWKCWQPATR